MWYGFRAHFFAREGEGRVWEVLGRFSNLLSGSGLWCR